MTAYVLRDWEDTILVDPLVAGDTDPLLAALDDLVPDACASSSPRLPTLDALTRLDIERVLVTHGEPVLRDGARALKASLARAPWSRSSFY